MSCEGYYVGQEIFAYRPFSAAEIARNGGRLDELEKDAEDTLLWQLQCEAEKCGFEHTKPQFHKPITHGPGLAITATITKMKGYPMSIQESEAASAAVVKAPEERVSLASMEAKIKHKYEFVAAAAIDAMMIDMPPPAELELLSICILVMQNGFIVIGKAAPVSAKNFNRDLGRKFAYEDAIRQLWPLEGYALRERLVARAADRPGAA